MNNEFVMFKSSKLTKSLWKLQSVIITEFLSIFGAAVIDASPSRSGPCLLEATPEQKWRD
jgi:hypothetical protein